MTATLLPLAAEIFDRDLSKLIEPAGGAAAILAILGMLLLLPLYVTQRREVQRLLEWRERDPHAGEPEFSPPPAGYAEPTTGSMSAAAARVTSERPALARIGTAERAAIEFEQKPFWRRVVERGPRHPLVISLITLLLAAGIFVGVGLLLRAGDESTAPERGKVVPADVEVVVVNAASASGVAGVVAEDVEAADFVVTGTTAASGTEAESAVLHAPGSKAEGRAVSRSLRIPNLFEFDAEAEAAANGATVVVLVGDDLAKAEAQSGRQER